MRCRLLIIGCMTLAGCLALPRMASATPPPITENVINLSFDGVTFPISPAYIALYSSAGPTDTFDGYATLQNIPAGDSTQMVIYSPAANSQTVPATLGGSPDFYGIGGVYTAGDGVTQGLTVGINSTQATAIEGETFAQAEPSGAPSEAATIAFLNSPNVALLPTSLGAFVNGFTSQIAPALVSTDSGTAQLVDFSTGTGSGTVLATIGTAVVTPPPAAVPLPTAASGGLALLWGLATMAAIRRTMSHRN